MDSLPYEILVHIFQFLPLSSRKRVRAVNKSWNNACCDPFIIKRERFRISGKYFYSEDDIFACLSASCRTIINLKFSEYEEPEFFSEDNVSSSFWLNCGTRVRSLEFGEICYIQEEQLFPILKCCPNLNEFNGLYLRFQLDYALKSLSDSNVILKKVNFLSLREFFWDDTCRCLYKNLLKVFPNVRKLNFGPVLDQWDENYYRLDNIFCPAWDYVRTISSNLQYLELGYTRHRSYNPSDLGEPESLTQLLKAVKHMKTLKLNEVDFLTRFNVIQLRNLKNLSTLCFNAKETTQSVCELIIEMLGNLPKLRHLEINEALDFGWNNNVAEKLITSSLETLKIMKTAGLNDEADVIANDSIVYNDTLKNLVIDFSTGSIPESICLFFVKYFRKLQTLSFEKNLTSSNVMKNLRIHQTNLYTLTVTIKTCNYSGVDFYGPQLFSFRQFQYLEKLNLKIISDFRDESEFTFTYFVLPRLKYLKVQFDVVPGHDYMNSFNLNLVNFLYAIEKLSCLESLKLIGYCEEIPMNLVLRLCESLKNLERLYIWGKTHSRSPEKLGMVKYAELSNLFRVRESLRLISYEGLYLFKHIISQEINCDRWSTM